jgi:SAM-dependent methyltransferase
MSPKKTFVNLDKKSRIKKSNMILSIIKHILGKKILSRNFRILNIGTGSGVLEKIISERFPDTRVYSVDILDHRIEKDGYKFIRVKGEKLPFSSNSFDLVISNSVMEHVNSPKRHFKEIYRVLKKSGMVYLGVPNKYWWLEHHFNVPFLSFFPKSISNVFCKIFFNREFDLNLYSHRSLKKLLNMNFTVKDFTPTLLKNPKKYSVDIFSTLHKITSCMPVNILKLCSCITPAFIFILKKT